MRIWNQVSYDHRSTVMIYNTVMQYYTAMIIAYLIIYLSFG